MVDLISSSIEQKLNRFGFSFEIDDIKNWTLRSKFLPGIIYRHHIEDVDDFYLFYQECITLAIHSSNWKLVKCFWAGYYYYDRAFPNFNDVLTMAEFGDSKTFLLGLSGILTWMCVDSHVDVTFEELKILAMRNPNFEVSEIIDRLLLIPNVLTMPEVEATSSGSDDSSGCEEWLLFRKKLVENLMEEFEMLEEYKTTKQMEPRKEDV
jgi:hypothetical protein